MSDHEWCRDVQRDEAVRAAEDAAAVPSIQHRDLPEQVALVWASLGDLLGRVVRLEGEFDAGQDEEAAPAVCDSAHLDANRGESVRVVEAATIGTGDVFADVQCGSTADEIARLTAERDAAIRERDAAREEYERLRARADPFGEEMAVIAAWERCAITADWPADEPETAVRCAASMEREIVRLRARVAELEAAAAGTAGGESNNPQQPESLPEQVAFMMSGPFEKRVFLSREEVYAYRRKLSPIEAASVIFVPLYDAPPPRGWMTAEEREQVQRARDELLSGTDGYDNEFANEKRRRAGVLTALLARETPPKVKVPPAAQGETPLVRDLMWGQAIRAAGGEVADA